MLCPQLVDAGAFTKLPLTLVNTTPVPAKLMVDLVRAVHAVLCCMLCCECCAASTLCCACRVTCPAGLGCAHAVFFARVSYSRRACLTLPRHVVGRGLCRRYYTSCLTPHFLSLDLTPQMKMPDLQLIIAKDAWNPSEYEECPLTKIGACGDVQAGSSRSGWWCQPCWRLVASKHSA